MRRCTAVVHVIGTGTAVVHVIGTGTAGSPSVETGSSRAPQGCSTSGDSSKEKCSERFTYELSTKARCWLDPGHSGACEARFAALWLALHPQYGTIPSMPASRSAHRSPSLWQATLLVARMELRSSLRDRQTAIYSVVLPICLYPILFWMMIQGALLVQGRHEHTTVQVAIARAPGATVPDKLVDAVRLAADAPAQGPHIERIEPEFVGYAPDAESAWAEWTARDPRADALLFFSPPDDQGNETPAILCYDSTRSASVLAHDRLAKRVKAHARDVRADRALEHGIDPSDLQGVNFSQRDLADDREKVAYILSMLLPLLLVVMAVMGAFFPAVDTSAGERERGTHETTMLLPVPRLAVHQGKILSVCALALFATGLNLLALGLSAGHLLEMIASGGKINVELPLAALAMVAPFAMLFTFSVSAIMCGIAALAKSFKEGQALLGPVQLLFIMPAMAGVLPGIELDLRTALIPVVNVVLVFRSLLRGEVLPIEYAMTALSLLIYAWLSIVFAVRVLSREALFLSTESTPLLGLLRFLRSPKGTR
ncbi:MAG TPA: ABC transporter permease [Planctomycetes bacterium]|nr:ABC transporter permease [Planctomycetota bacterium]